MVSVIESRGYHGTYSRVLYAEHECCNLNLNVVRILGFEKIKNLFKLENFVDLIDEGVQFPPVFLFPTENDLEFRLTLIDDHLYKDLHHRKGNYGGHHRAVSHYIEDKPLRCLILDPKAYRQYENEIYEKANLDEKLFPIEESMIF